MSVIEIAMFCSDFLRSCKRYSMGEVLNASFFGIPEWQRCWLLRGMTKYEVYKGREEGGLIGRGRLYG